MLIKSCTKPKDTVLILFGGSGSEIEICKNLGRQYISAEIDEKYYKVIDFIFFKPAKWFIKF